MDKSPDPPDLSQMNVPNIDKSEEAQEAHEIKGTTNPNDVEKALGIDHNDRKNVIDSNNNNRNDDTDFQFSIPIDGFPPQIPTDVGNYACLFAPYPNTWNAPGVDEISVCFVFVCHFARHLFFLIQTK